jgi:hypothetical protein
VVNAHNHIGLYNREEVAFAVHMCMLRSNLILKRKSSIPSSPSACVSLLCVCVLVFDLLHCQIDHSSKGYELHHAVRAALNISMTVSEIVD